VDISVQYAELNKARDTYVDISGVSIDVINNTLVIFNTILKYSRGYADDMRQQPRLLYFVSFTIMLVMNMLMI
jgi:hypothetical protein